jgi:hypothetical protein
LTDESESDKEQEGGGLEELLWPPELLATIQRYGREKRTKRVERETLAQGEDRQIDEGRERSGTTTVGPG